MSRTRVAVVGASGYTGQELLRLILMHEQVELVAVTSRQYAGQRLEEVFPRFRQMPGADLEFVDATAERVIESGAEAAFLALPHGVAAAYARPLVEAGLKVIDLSADFRVRDPEVYQEFYGEVHPDVALLKEAVFGLPEVYAEEIRRARLVASPGCYPTSILLPLLPLLREPLIECQDIVTFSMSGVSGAGRKADIPYLFTECNESVRAYGAPKHRHLSEIEQELSVAAGERVVMSFTPHLIPVTSGICTTTSVRLKAGVAPERIEQALLEAYAGADFVRLLGKAFADTKNVTRTNFIDIGSVYDPRTGRVLLSSAEDNLVKGAGGQAIQSFNLMFGLCPRSGLQIV